MSIKFLARTLPVLLLLLGLATACGPSAAKPAPEKEAAA
ncbi:MAG: hypothetical protein HW403_1109, partial [Dehalococcoidia bacterium]|nr:hypothetical protein [Dehalococcoidia bacterium]